MCGRSDPRGSVDVETDVVVAARDSFTAMEADPDAHRLATRPGRSREGSLRRDGRCDRRGRIEERHEERVAFGRVLGSARCCKRGSEKSLVLLQRFTIGRRSKRLEETGRTLDVAEEERERAGRFRPFRGRHR